MNARRRRAPADEAEDWPPCMCPHCGGAITTGQRGGRVAEGDGLLNGNPPLDHRRFSS
jgi:hypothetical protein